MVTRLQRSQDRCRNKRGVAAQGSALWPSHHLDRQCCKPRNRFRTGMDFQWTELTLLQILSWEHGHPGVREGRSLLVYLLLAAQRTRVCCLPLAVILVVPDVPSLFGHLESRSPGTGYQYFRARSDSWCLVGLAAKNAILIVPKIRQREASGRNVSAFDAAVEAYAGCGYVPS